MEKSREEKVSKCKYAKRSAIKGESEFVYERDRSSEKKAQRNEGQNKAATI